MGGIKNKTSSNTTNVTSASGQSQTGDVGGNSQNLTGVQLGAGATLSLLDGGAVSGGLDLAREALGFAQGAGERADVRTAASSSQLADAYTSARQLGGAVDFQKILLALIAGGVILGAVIVFGKH